MSVEVLREERVAAAPEPAAGPRLGRWATVAVAVVVATGALLRLRSPSALWLDESISVSISSLPLGQVQDALRHDGAPPLYALLLWVWERAFGASPTAVRSLSALFGIAALPLAALSGSRLAGRAGAVAAVLLLATSPFAVYYSSEARMYSLVVLLVLCAHLVLDDYLRAPSVGRGLLVALLAAALALTHYWALFLLGVVGLGLLLRARRRGQRVDLTAALWMAGGGVLFLPWVPTFLFQVRHTGAPWGTAPGLSAALGAVTTWSGGSSASGRLLSLLLLLLALVGATAVSSGGTRVELDLRGRSPGRALVLVAAATMVLGLAIGQLSGSAFAARYSSVAFPVFLLVVALGVVRLPARLQTGALVVAVVAGLAGAVPQALDARKTQAPVLAEALRAEALPGDVVVYCPDQLGPATSRLLPAGLVQEVYPTGGSPARVDWVDYAKRNAAADPQAFAARVAAQAAGRAVWLVEEDSYRTIEGQCAEVGDALTALRGTPLTLVERDPRYYEKAQLRGWAPTRRPGR